jgi:drug/metabolite transporter (DMT)-like permease
VISVQPLSSVRRPAPSQARIYGLVCLMTLIWSLNYVVAKIALRSFPPVFFACLRMMLAGALMSAVYGVWIRRRPAAAIQKWPWRDLLIVAGVGVLGMVGNQIFFVVGIDYTSVAHASLVIATTPVQVLVLAWLRGQERLNQRKAIGMALAVAGVAVLNLSPGRSARGASIVGDFLIFLCAFSFAVYTVFTKERLRRYGSIPINSLGYAVSTLLLIAPVWLWGREFHYAAVPAVGWWMLAYMAVLSSVVCYMIFSYALGFLAASRVASFSYAQPLIASLAAWWLLGEPVTLAVALGGGMVLAGVWLTSRN